LIGVRFPTCSEDFYTRKHCERRLQRKSCLDALELFELALYFVKCDSDGEIGLYSSFDPGAPERSAVMSPA
jgi:hypothetical protein